MNFTNWLYLGTGIGLGIGFCKLLLQIPKNQSTKVESAKVESAKFNSTKVEISPPKEEAKIDPAELQKTQLAYEMAREMSLFQGGFLARTSHELRSPLNGLIGLHQLIINDLCEDIEEEREFVNQAHERALKLLKMIDEILIVARTEHGKDKLEIRPIKLNDVFQEVHRLTHTLAANRNYPFHVSFPEPDIYVLGDFNWLRQILVSLIDNAILKMEEGSIYLSAERGFLDHQKDVIHICLDIPKDAFISYEALDLVGSKEVISQENPEISSGMKLLLNQKLLGVMGGKLEVISSPITHEVTQDWIRLQVSIPSGTPEVEFLLEE